MKKLIPILFLLICGCARPSGPVVVRNAYFNDIFFTNYYVDYTDYPFIVDEAERVFGRDYGTTTFSMDFDNCGIDCGVDYYFIAPRFRSSYGEPLPDNFWIFQDDDRKCLLYSYTKEDMLALKNKAGFSMTDYGAVFLLEKTGIRVVSREKYEKLKPTLQPHRYDQALCKPEPDWSKYSDTYYKIRGKDAPPTLHPILKNLTAVFLIFCYVGGLALVL